MSKLVSARNKSRSLIAFMINFLLYFSFPSRIESRCNRTRPYNVDVLGFKISMGHYMLVGYYKCGEHIGEDYDPYNSD